MSDIGPEDKRDDDLSRPFNPGARRDAPQVKQEDVVEEVPEQESHLPPEDLPGTEPRVTHEAMTQEEEDAAAAEPKPDPRDAA